MAWSCVLLVVLPMVVAACGGGAPLREHAQPRSTQPEDDEQGKATNEAQPTADGGAPGTARASCPAGQQRIGQGCCWPDQQWDATAKACQGEPTCPDGFVLAGDSCITLATKIESWIDSCAALAIPQEGAEPAGAAQQQHDCTLLSERLADADQQLRKRCAAGEWPVCALLGSSRRQRKTVAFAVELQSPMCRRSKGECQGHSRRVLQIEFAGKREDPTAAAQSLRQACDGGHLGGCIELGLMLGADRRVQAAEVFRKVCQRGHAAACAEAVYLSHTTSRVVDPVLYRRAAEVLTARCKAGGALACNNLGFMIERRLVESGGPKRAAIFYQKACDAGAIVGCANLVYLGYNHRRLARKLEYGDAAKKLQSACNNNVEQACLAYGVMLRRGLGVRRRYRESREILKRLCADGLAEACAVR